MEKLEMVLATRNAGKAAELQALLRARYGAKITLLTLSEIGFEGDIEETGQTFAENALLKARAAAAEYIQKVRMLLDREQTFLATLADADLTGAVVTPAPAAKKAIAAPAEEVEAAPVEEEVLPAAEEPEAEPEAEEEESPLYPDAAEDEQDYVKAFENAVYQTPDTADEDAPKISF